MGNMVYAYITNPDTAPDIKEPPTFDPFLGFPCGRKERSVQATRKQVEQFGIPLERRDYCVDYYISFLKCRQKNLLHMKNCAHEMHEYDVCEYEDYVLRMKEYEREKRLKERAKKLDAVGMQEELVG
ncbi:NADH dehydrogenase [ubiquinone] 1 beta subcomplex subunit 7-like [Gigantopelta aegis]|uniref:NADH dehydrogenase [ubiquinone] 1 beta subcomplex subunit 7-like n=1 Tax=Gigantopelta aegis TaxID=1735272 RepID=UPI001B8890A0|nr:NADH dehydrogenase [ubiquinone] 1 beta subcomplex subunit 7-like [Gigantopelta aegis]